MNGNRFEKKGSSPRRGEVRRGKKGVVPIKTETLLKEDSINTPPSLPLALRAKGRNPIIKSAAMALCPHFGICGGCSTQDKPYPHQLVEKEIKVRELLSGLDVKKFLSVVGSPDVYFYRNKMEFSFGNQKDVEILSRPWVSRKERREKSVQSLPPPSLPERVHLGLHPRKRFNLVTPTPECLLLSLESQKICSIVSAWATKFKIPTYTRHNHKGILRYLVIKEGKNSKDRMVNLISTSAVTYLEELKEDLRGSQIPISTFIGTVNDGLSDVAKGEASTIFWGTGVIQEKLDQKVFYVTPASFMQTNTRAAELMIRQLREWIQEDLKSKQRETLLFDLFCGSGAIGLNLAELMDRVVGVEVDAAAVNQAKENAELNGCRNVEFHVGRAEDWVALFGPTGKNEEKFIVVDPPRPGLHPKVVEALLEAPASHLYYVSCNPVSLARDLRVLGAKYRIETVQPMDFFPHTDHVETLVKMQS